MFLNSWHYSTRFAYTVFLLSTLPVSCGDDLSEPQQRSPFLRASDWGQPTGSSGRKVRLRTSDCTLYLPFSTSDRALSLQTCHSPLTPQCASPLLCPIRPSVIAFLYPSPCLYEWLACSALLTFITLSHLFPVWTLTHTLGQWFSSGDIWECVETFLVVTNWARGCFWHLAGRGQGGRKMAWNGQDILATDSAGPRCQQR